MRSRIIVLLAVCSGITAAGPLRNNGARVQHQNIARFLNHTETPSLPADIQTSTFIPISSTIVAETPLTPDVVSRSSLAADALTLSTPSQILSTPVTLSSTLSSTAVSAHSDAASETTSVSASALVHGGNSNGENHGAVVVQPTETFSRLFNLAGSPPNDLQSSMNAPSFSFTPSSATSASSLTTFRITNVAATPLSSSVEKQAPSSSGAASFTSPTATASQTLTASIMPVPTSSTAAASQASSQLVVPIPISSGIVQVLGAGGDTVDEFAPVTLDPSSPAPTGTAKYPSAEGGNTVMATGFNNVYKTLNEDTPCNPSDPSQAYACVDGEIAECQSDETYVLKSCPRGQSCYALPKTSGLVGVVVQCAVPSDAYSMLAGLSSSTAVPVTVTSQPAPMLQAEGDFSQATQSVSAQESVQAVTSSPSVQAIIQNQSQAPAPSVLAVTATASQNQASDRVDESSVIMGTSPTSTQAAFPILSQAPTPSVLSVAITAQQAPDFTSLNNSPKSETSPSAPSTTAAIASVPKALFAVVTENNQVPPTGNSAQASFPTPQTSQPSRESSTAVTQSSAMPPQASPDQLEPMESTVSSTRSISADSASITFTPTGVPVNEKVGIENGQATVTVTVTVTTTEKTPPVTIISS